MRKTGPITMDHGSMELNIQEYCKLLMLSSIADHYESEAINAAKTKLSYQEYLYRLLQQQIIDRVDRSVNARIKKAGFPSLNTLEEFDFTFQPQLDEKLIRELSTLQFLKEARNILFVGPPGVGKTHLATAIGLEAARQRRRVKFTTAETLTNELIAAKQSNTLPDYIEAIGRIELLIIDEIGYLDIHKESASLFFKVVSKRYEKNSTIITTNKPFQEWGEIFGDDVIATAILDRLLHHAYPFLIQGKSYRMKTMFGPDKTTEAEKEKNTQNG